MVGRVVEAGAFVFPTTGDNVYEESVSVIKPNAAAEVVDGVDLASAQRTSKNND